MRKVFASAIAISAALSLSGCALLYPNWGTDEKPSDPQTAEPSQPSPSQTESSSPTPSVTPVKPKTQVSINIIDSVIEPENGQIMVVAEALGIEETGGSCKLTFESSTLTKSVPGKAEPNVTSTQCFPLQLPVAGLPKGAAKLYVSYESSTSVGKSSAIAITIP